jgi:hypothetical protein
VQIKFKDGTLSQLLIAPNSCKNPAQQSQQGMSGPGEKAPPPFLFSFFLLSPNKKKLQSCSSETAEQTGEHQKPHAINLPTPQENNLAQPL